MVKKCLACGKPIRPNKNNPGYSSGYGPICFKRLTPTPEPTTTQTEIAELRRELDILKEQLYAITTTPKKIQTTPSNRTPNPQPTIPTMKFDIDISELKNNALFLKMKELTN